VPKWLIYAISTDDSGLILRGDKVLEDLASATAGALSSLTR